MASTVVVRTVAPHVRTVMINRPLVRNAVDRETAAALKAAFLEFDRDSDAYVAVLYGADGQFCSGADLKAVASQNASTANDVSELGPMGPTALTLNKPVIAAVQGNCVAGGLELAVWCDLRVVEKSAVMGVFCRRFGVPLIDGGTVRLPRLIGQSRALDLILTGRAVDATEALAMGLANRVVEDGNGIQAAIDLATTLTKFPQDCMRADRASALDQHNRGVIEAMERERFVYGRRALESPDFVTGPQHFVQSRHTPKSNL